MKSAKEVRNTARKLMAASVDSGRLNTDTVRIILRKLVDEKPSGYVQLLKAYRRLVRLKVEEAKVKVESAVELDAAVKKQVLSDLERKYGDHIEADFVVDPELLGGMKVTVGSDVWDGSVKNRIERLESKFR